MNEYKNFVFYFLLCFLKILYTPAEKRKFELAAALVIIDTTSSVGVKTAIKYTLKNFIIENIIIKPKYSS